MVLVKSTLANLALVSITGASPIAQAVDFGRGATECGLAPEDPKSWGASGAEKLLGEWLDKNGPGRKIEFELYRELTFVFRQMAPRNQQSKPGIQHLPDRLLVHRLQQLHCSRLPANLRQIRLCVDPCDCLKS